MSENNFIRTKIFGLNEFELTSSFDNGAVNISKIYNYTPLTSNNQVTNDYTSNNIDYSDPTNYVKFGSFQEYIKRSLNNIKNIYPHNIYISPNMVGREYGDVNIYDIVISNNTTSFKINTNYVNTSFINYLKESKVNFLNYNFYYEGVNYTIIELIGSKTTRNSYLTLTVSGTPFENEINKNISAYINPNDSYKNSQLSQLTGFERYIVGDSFILNDLYEGDIFNFSYKKKYAFPKINFTQLDFSSKYYDEFVNDLMQLAFKYDDNQLNITERLLIPYTIQDIDIDDNNNRSMGKINTLLSVISGAFDRIYEKINNVYDTNIDYYKISDEYRLSYSNSRAYVYDTLLKYNIPSSLIEFNEHVYKTRIINYDVVKKVYNQYKLNIASYNLPLTEKGEPNINKLTGYFQEKNYFNGLKNVFPDVEDIFIVDEITTTSGQTFYSIVPDISGEVMNFVLSGYNITNSACVNISGDIINSSLPRTFVDECGCEVDREDYVNSLHITPINPYINNCPKLLIDVVPQCIVNTTTGDTISGETLCHYFYNILSSDDIGNSVKLETSELGINVTYKTRLTSTCFDVIETDYNQLIEVYTCYDIDILPASGYLTTIKLYDTDLNSPITLDLNPYTTSYLTGCSGTLVINDLLFPNDEELYTTWEQSIITLIENAICSEFSHLGVPENNLNYLLDVNVIDGVIRICLLNKNNPTLDYNIGINRNDALLGYYNGSYETLSNITHVFVEDINIIHNREVCEILELNKIIDGDELVSLLTVNYNSLILSGDHITLIDNDSYNETSCIVENYSNEINFEYGAYLNLNIYGGTPPYTLYGIDEEILYASGVIYSVFIEDASGCVSNTVSGSVICPIDRCNEYAFIERNRIVEVEVEVPTSGNCVSIPITFDLFRYFYEGDYDNPVPETFQIYYSHNFNNPFTIPVNMMIEIQSGSSSFFINTTNEEHFEVINTYPDFQGSGDFNVSITPIVNNQCSYEEVTNMFNVFDEFSSPITLNIEAISSSGSTIVTSSVTETYIEYGPVKPQLTASYTCNDDGTATLNLNVFGGYEPLTYFGGNDGAIVNNNQIIEVYVQGSDGCKSDTITLNIDCDPPIECSPIIFNGRLETTSRSLNEKIATLTFSYLIENDLDIDQVTVVASAQGISSNYMIGNPVLSVFNGGFGANQLNFDFNPNNFIPVEIKFVVIIKTEQGCEYKTTFNLNVDPTILSNTDIYNVELI